MRISRLFYDGPIEAGQSLTLDQPASHYLATVLRSKQGHSIIVFNGLGGEYHGTISKLHKRQSMIQVDQFIDRNPESPCHVTLLQAIAKSDRMDYSIQKATELGVTQIIPIMTEFSQSLSKPEKKQQHWQNIIISACEQSGRTKIPNLLPPQTLQEAVTAPYDIALFLNTQSDQALLHSNHHQSIAVLIGPEGGFSVTEQQQIITHQFLSLSLGPRILRTETAAVAAITLAMHMWGDMA